MPSRDRQLTDILLRNFPAPPAGQVQYPDGKIPGFGVRVTAAGLKTFYFTYRFHGLSRRLTLGRYPYTSLAEARGKAHGALTSLSKGKDPQPNSATSTIFADAVDRFVELHCKLRNRSSTVAETKRLLHTTFLPSWRRRPLIAIARPDVLAVIDAIMKENKPAAANHAFAAVRKFFNWCVERGMIDGSPCLGIKSPARPGKRNRVLADAELAKLWRATTAEVTYPFGPVFQLLALTAQRRGEIVGMRWTEFDLEQTTWTIPAGRTKNGLPHTVPLTPAVVAIIDSLPRFDSVFVFPARCKPDRLYSGYSKGKRALDAAAKLHDWTLHDLRRTAATGMAGLGVAPHVVERVLNHVSGIFGGVHGIYNRFQYLAEMRDALTQWERHLIKLIADGGNTRAEKPVEPKAITGLAVIPEATSSNHLGV